MRSSFLSALTPVAGASLALFSLLIAPAARAVDEAAKYPKTDGDGPVQNLTVADDGDLYGVTPYGGEYGYGALFQFDPRGSGNPIILHSFSGRNDDGKNPSSPPLEDENGNFYGVTQYGGVNDTGVIYTPHRRWTLYPALQLQRRQRQMAHVRSRRIRPRPVRGHRVHRREGRRRLSLYVPGRYHLQPNPSARRLAQLLFLRRSHRRRRRPNGLLLGPGNLLYGTTVLGGTSDQGTVFAFDPTTRTFHVLHNFSGGDDGANPLGSLLYANGLFYGTTDSGGIADGTIYTVDLAGSHQTLYRFHSYNYGLIPQSAPVMTTAGDLLVTLGYDGEFSHGLVFDYTGSHGLPNRASQFRDFTFFGDGSMPISGLTQADDGLFYGVTEAGGSNENLIANNNYGTIYVLDPATMHHTVRHSFGEDKPSVANQPHSYFAAPAAIPRHGKLRKLRSRRRGSRLPLHLQHRSRRRLPPR